MGSDDDLIRLNSVVVVCRRQTRRIEYVKERPTHLAPKMPKLSMKTAVGQPYGNFKLVLDKEADVFNLEVLDGADALPHEAQMEQTTVTRDNREILDTSTSQKLTMEEIEEKKRGGVLGSEMVDLLVDNSETYASKSEYSQQKYVRKKMNKYADRITLLKPTLRLVSEILFEADPMSIMCLRLDTLSLMLTISGVSSGGKYLVLESGTSGLVTAGALERMGGEGSLVKVNLKAEFRRNDLSAVDKLDLSAKEKEPLACLPLADFACLQPGWQDPPEHDNQFRARAREAIREGSFDAVLVAIKEDPSELLKLFLPLLAWSKPFAVFSQYREVLAACHVMLKQSGGYVQLQLTENWLREYQVLPGRTHPLVTMSGNGGFLLTGIKVDDGRKRAAAAVVVKAAENGRAADSGGSEPALPAAEPVEVVVPKEEQI